MVQLICLIPRPFLSPVFHTGSDEYWRWEQPGNEATVNPGIWSVQAHTALWISATHKNHQITRAGDTRMEPIWFMLTCRLSSRPKPTYTKGFGDETSCHGDSMCYVNARVLCSGACMARSLHDKVTAWRGCYIGHTNM